MEFCGALRPGRAKRSPLKSPAASCVRMELGNFTDAVLNKKKPLSRGLFSVNLTCASNKFYCNADLGKLY